MSIKVIEKLAAELSRPITLAERAMGTQPAEAKPQPVTEQPKPSQPEFYSTYQLAKKHNIHRTTIRRAVKTGRLKATIAANGRALITLTDYQAWRDGIDLRQPANTDAKPVRPEDSLTVTEVAQQFNLSKSAVHGGAKGGLKATKVGNQLYIMPDDVRAWRKAVAEQSQARDKRMRDMGNIIKQHFASAEGKQAVAAVKTKLVEPVTTGNEDFIVPNVDSFSGTSYKGAATVQKAFVAMARFRKNGLTPDDLAEIVGVATSSAKCCITALRQLGYPVTLNDGGVYRLLSTERQAKQTEPLLNINKEMVAL